MEPNITIVKKKAVIALVFMIGTGKLKV